MSIHLLGIGWVNSEGLGLGRSGLPFVPGREPLPEIKGKQLFKAPNKHFGRFDAFTKAGFSAACLAVRDAGLSDLKTRRQVGIIAETCYGSNWTDQTYFDTVVPEQGKFASPNLFAYTLSSCFVGEVSIFHKFTGETIVLNRENEDGFKALELAVDTIKSGRCRQMLVGYNHAIPAEVVSKTPVPCGSLFILVGKDDFGSSYGAFEMGKNELSVEFAGVSFSSLNELAQSCSGRKQS